MKERVLEKGLQCAEDMYGVAMIGRLPKNIGLFCTI